MCLTALVVLYPIIKFYYGDFKNGICVGFKFSSHTQITVELIDLEFM